MFTKYRVLVAGVSLAAAAALLGPAAAANADLGTSEVAASVDDARVDSPPQKRKFSTQGRDGEHGFATGRLAVNFGSKRYVSGLKVSAKDHCAGNPGGDGKGAYLNGSIHFMDGTIEHHMNASDEDGCGNGGVTDRHWGDEKYKKIKMVSARLCERDTDGPADTTCTKWKRIDNPYTK